jgi:hypothetical protein
VNAVVKEKPLIKLDLGCGPNPKEGYVGVDSIAFNEKVQVFDLRTGPWPWEDNSVSEANCSHFLEHLTNLDGKWERVRFFNELYRIMVPGGQCTLIFPHWASNRFYGDPTHKEPISEMAFYYLDPNWRKVNAPHTDIEHNPNGYSCYWNCTWNYTLHPEVAIREQKYQQYAMTFYKEACQDFVMTITANKS